MCSSTECKNLSWIRPIGEQKTVDPICTNKPLNLELFLIWNTFSDHIFTCVTQNGWFTKLCPKILEFYKVNQWQLWLCDKPFQTKITCHIFQKLLCCSNLSIMGVLCLCKHKDLDSITHLLSYKWHLRCLRICETFMWTDWYEGNPSLTQGFPLTTGVLAGYYTIYFQ